MDLLKSDMFIIKGKLLYRQSKEDGMQLVMPKCYHKHVLELGHSVPWSGHLGFMKTLMRVAKRLVPIPAVNTPFEKIGVDVVGPLQKTQKGNRFILVICDYATRYPEAYSCFAHCKGGIN